jgi:hypothetical protein
MVSERSQSCHRRLYIVLFHLYEMLRIGRPIETENKLVMGWREWEWERGVTAGGNVIQKALKLGCD